VPGDLVLHVSEAKLASPNPVYGHGYDFAPIKSYLSFRVVRSLMHESSESKKESKESRTRGSPSRSCQERSFSQRA
jgi:hypothetical protein